MTLQEKLDSIRENPSRHRHTFEELLACSFMDGAISTAVMQAHEGLNGHNGGVPCDTRRGPCSCGSWH